MILNQSLRFSPVVQSKNESTRVVGGYFLGAPGAIVMCQYTPMSIEQLVKATGEQSLKRPHLGICELSDADNVPFQAFAEDIDTGEVFIVKYPVQRFKAGNEADHAEFILERLMLEGVQESA